MRAPAVEVPLAAPAMLTAYLRCSSATIGRTTERFSLSDRTSRDVRSLKEKRSVVRPIVAELHRKYAVSVAETSEQDLYRRARIGLAAVSGEAGHLTEVLDRCERLVAARPEVELLSVRRRIHSDDDE